MRVQINSSRPIQLEVILIHTATLLFVRLWMLLDSGLKLKQLVFKKKKFRLTANSTKALGMNILDCFKSRTNGIYSFHVEKISICSCILLSKLHFQQQSRIRKGVSLFHHRAVTKKNFWVPLRNWTSMPLRFNSSKGPRIFFSLPYLCLHHYGDQNLPSFTSYLQNFRMSFKEN